MGIIKEKYGHKWSQDSFDGYKLRVKLVARNADSDVEVINRDIYTTCEDRERIHNVLIHAARNFGHNNNMSVVADIVNYSTAEQDEMSEKFINELLKV